VDIVAQAQAHRPIDRLETFDRRRDPALDAGPEVVVSAAPAGDQQVLLERLGLCRQPAIGIEHKRGAVEHQLILAADLVAVDQRQPGLGDPRDREVHAHVLLVGLERRAVRHDQDLGAGFLQALRDVLGPHVLADHTADANLIAAAGQRERHRTGNRAGREDPLLVEHAVVRQVVLVAGSDDPAALQKQHGVVELAAIAPGRADDQRRAMIGGVLCERLDGALGIVLQGRLEHQVLRRVADHHELGEHDEVRPRLDRAGARGTDQGEIVLDRADRRIDLRDRDDELGIHGSACLSRKNGVARRCELRPISGTEGSRSLMRTCHGMAFAVFSRATTRAQGRWETGTPAGTTMTPQATIARCSGRARSRSPRSG
jgi:hypothetical protein